MMSGADKSSVSQLVSFTAYASLGVTVSHRFLICFNLDAANLMVVKWRRPPKRKLDSSKR
jgi:hypothetical protein